MEETWIHYGRRITPWESPGPMHCLRVSAVGIAGYHGCVDAITGRNPHKSDRVFLGAARPSEAWDLRGAAQRPEAARLARALAAAGNGQRSTARGRACIGVEVADRQFQPQGLTGTLDCPVIFGFARG